jgi:hypothetical protein
MKKLYILLLFAGLLTMFSGCRKGAEYKALIITGQSNDNWQASSSVLQLLLEQTGLFKADIVTTPPKGGDMSAFNPVFSKYELIVLDYNGDSWSDKTNNAFLEYVKNGGGVVVYRSADNAFPAWEEYNKIIGLGGWGNRNEKSGPYVYYRRDEVIRDDSEGEAGTIGARSDFAIRTRNSEHPITKGLPVNWMHGSDELYGHLRGPAENMEILATAFSPDPVPDQPSGTPRGFARRSGRDEAVLMTITYGNGRIFHTTLGVPDEGGGPAMQCAGFIVTFQRGAEWAASGKVTQEVPFDFPSAAGVVLRTDFKEIGLEDALANLGTYEITKSTKNFTFLRNYIRKISGDKQALLNLEKRLVTVLKGGETTTDAKKLILRELSWMGSDYSIPVIRDLVSDSELKDEAEFALTRLQPPN